MVQYVITPWRNRAELLLVKEQFCNIELAPATRRPASAAERHERQRQKRRDQHAAVARVAMWMQRGNCPHLVESTALLTAAVLSDEEADDENAASSSYALRAAYSAAFSRFVTGLLDGHQDKQRKQSMYAVAKTVGLPATFVELRHQSTHEQLPSLAKLRDAARKALDYIWDYYWKNLDDETPQPDTARGRGSDLSDEDPCRATVMIYMREFNPNKQQELMAEMCRRWDLERLESAVKEVQGKLPGNMAWLKGMQLVKELKAREQEKTTKTNDTPGKEETTEKATEEMDVVDEAGLRQEAARFRHFEGDWSPKPIGALISTKD